MKIVKVKNPILLVLFLIFTLVNLIDLLTSLFITPGESNPIYLLTGNIAVLAGFKLFLVLVIFWIYKKNLFPSRFWYFFFLHILVVGSYMLSLGIYNNFQGIGNPQLLEASRQLSTQVKLSMYIKFIAVIYTIPLVLSLLSFKLYELSQRTIKIEKDVFKDDSWWGFK